MAHHFNEFLQSEQGQDFVNGLTTGKAPEGALQENLEKLYTQSADELSKGTLITAYDPILDGLQKFAINGAVIMKEFGVAHRDFPDSRKEHNVTTRPSVDDVLAAIETEREYHDTMFEVGRETVSNKSPSELALTVIGLFNTARKETTIPAVLKYLKDAVATAVRALEEAQQPGSIAEKSRQHYQEKHVVN